MQASFQAMSISTHWIFNMDKKLLRIKWRTFKFELIEKVHDLVQVALPVVFMVFLIGGAVRLAAWVYGFNI